MNDSDPLLRLSQVTDAMGEVVKRFERDGWFETHDRAGLRVLVDAMVAEMESQRAASGPRKMSATDR